MLAVAPSALVGSPTPRIGPPAPLRHDLAGYRETAATLGITPMPWQDTAAMYATALDSEDHLLYREFAAVVSRQQGKTTFSEPLIVRRLRKGRRIMHIANLRELPRLMFELIADALEAADPSLFPKRRGKIIWPRRGFGSESIVLTNGGTYRISSALSGGRGFSFDDLLIDELREMDTFAVINAAKYAQGFSEDPQTVYLSNAGTDDSVILNSLRKRAGEPDNGHLAYLEWSAAPDLTDDDMTGWLQANPAIGHYPQVLDNLQQDYIAAKTGGNMAGFETERLCRWVPTMRPRLVDEVAWQRAHVLRVSEPRRPSLGISYDPSGRASVVMAWREDDKHVALRELFDVAVDETGIPELGADALKTARRFGVVSVGYDDATDRDLARQFSGTFAKKVKSVIGKDFANATEAFVRGIESGQVRWTDGEHIAADLRATSRKDNDETGAYHAVRSKDDVPITAALAAIRAHWLASAVSSSGSLRVQ